MTNQPGYDPRPTPSKNGKARRAQHTVMEALTDVVVEAYVDERVRWEREKGGAKKHFNPEKWRPAFRKMVVNFVTCEIVDYRTYIHVQFEDRKAKTIPPTPQQCYGKVADQKWRRYCLQRTEVVDKLRTALKYQQRLLAGEAVGLRETVAGLSQEWTEQDIRSSILLDQDLELSALFRYGVALESALPDVAAVYRDAALLQYLFARRAYDEVWGDRIPLDLKQEADQALLEIRA